MHAMFGILSCDGKDHVNQREKLRLIVVNQACGHCIIT